MLVEEQIQARQQRAKDALKQILPRPKGSPFGDDQVLSTSSNEYRVAMRGPGLFDNYCSCPDFARNTLGTCKHIESLLARLRRRYRSKLEHKRYEREPAGAAAQGAMGGQAPSGQSAVSQLVHKDPQ
ncbi:MAG: SWIM zinc finger domain-containing protein, partial [Bryobacterales bacterium]|nr:SWIM zinc finger domain-containing protein [Bryobacterales bacterium]